MFGKKTLVTLVAGVALMSLPAFAQEENPVYKNDTSVQAFGSFVKSTVQDGVEQNASNSGGVLASYRFFFNNHNGVELNYGYALNTQRYGLTGGPLGVQSHSHEVTADYVLRFPQRHWSPFVLAGVGGVGKTALALAVAARAAEELDRIPLFVACQSRPVASALNMQLRARRLTATPVDGVGRCI